MRRIRLKIKIKRTKKLKISLYSSPSITQNSTDEERYNRGIEHGMNHKFYTY